MQKKAFQANKKPVQPTAAAMMSSQNAATCTFRKGPHSTPSCGIVTDVSMQKGVAALSVYRRTNRPGESQTWGVRGSEELHHLKIKWSPTTAEDSIRTFAC